MTRTLSMARGTQRFASPRQIAFQFELVRERVVPAEASERLQNALARHNVARSNADRMPFEVADRNIKWLIRQPMKPGVVPSRIQAMPRDESRLPSAEQEAKWTREIQEREAAEEAHRMQFKMHRDQQLSAPRPEPKRSEPAPVGVYQKDGTIYVVKENRQGTRRYAVRLVVGAPRITENGEEVDFNYEKAPGMVYALTEADRMTKADMQDFMLKYRKCIRCGYHLHAAKTLKRSEELGVMVGKRCATKMGLI